VKRAAANETDRRGAGALVPKKLQQQQQKQKHQHHQQQQRQQQQQEPELAPERYGQIPFSGGSNRYAETADSTR